MKPSVDDMTETLKHAQFLYNEHLDRLCRRSEPEQAEDVEKIRIYFRAFLHCWKCVQDYLFEMKCVKKSKDKIRCMEEWYKMWPEHDSDKKEWERLKTIYEDLRETRDLDTHRLIVPVKQEIKGAGSSERKTERGTVYITCCPRPAVMFQTLNDDGTPKRESEILECARDGLMLAQRLINDTKQGEFPHGTHDTSQGMPPGGSLDSKQTSCGI